MPKLTNQQKAWLCLISNFIIMCVVVIMVSVFRDENSTYFRYGPSDSLIVISVKINTWTKWWFLILFIGLIKAGDVIVNEIGSPILGFNVYNPDKKVITEFTKNELNVITNSMWFINNFKGILLAVITVTQFDIALIGVIISETVSIFTVRHLLNGKKFIKDKGNGNAHSTDAKLDDDNDDGDGDNVELTDIVIGNDNDDDPLLGVVM